MDKEHFSTILPVSASDVDKIEILRDSLGIFDTAIFKEEFPKFLDLHNTSNIIRISHISQFTNDYHISREFDSEDSRDVKKNWYSSIEDSKFENEIDYEPQNPESRCPICLEEDVEFDTLGCSDKYCVSCITLVLENFINSMEVFPNQAKCYLCSHSISDETFKSHIHPDLYKRMLFLREKIHRDQLVASGQAIHCISLDCNGYAYLFDNELLTACIICRVSLCVGCKRGSHPTLTCEENQCRNPEDSIDEILFSRH